MFNNGFVYNALLASLVVYYVTRTYWKAWINLYLISNFCFSYNNELSKVLSSEAQRYIRDASAWDEDTYEVGLDLLFST